MANCSDGILVGTAGAGGSLSMTQRLAEPEYGLVEEEARTAVLSRMSVTPYKPVINAYNGLPVLTQLRWLDTTHVENSSEAALH